LLLWIEGSVSPQEIRDRITQDDTFRTSILCWLESCHKGEYSLSSENQIGARINERKKQGKHDSFDITESAEKEATEGTCRDPATTLPERPPIARDEQSVGMWYQKMCCEVDEIVYLSNRHDKKHRKGCLKGQPAYCKARFPRETRNETEVDPDTGAIRFKKGEAWINTYNVVLSYVLRCNSDVTCLLSGTQVRAVVAYVTDYVTKCPLKTYKIFEVVKMI
ncbi:hypothetical protein C8Q79DRAFT_872024, partial [Trametes meyenii]